MDDLSLALAAMLWLIILGVHNTFGLSEVVVATMGRCHSVKRGNRTGESAHLALFDANLTTVYLLFI